MTGEVVRKSAKDTSSPYIIFVTGPNAHITARNKYFTTFQKIKDSERRPTIYGFADAGFKAKNFIQ